MKTNKNALFDLILWKSTIFNKRCTYAVKICRSFFRFTLRSNIICTEIGWNVMETFLARSHLQQFHTFVRMKKMRTQQPKKKQRTRFFSLATLGQNLCLAKLASIRFIFAVFLDDFYFIIVFCTALELRKKKNYRTRTFPIRMWLFTDATLKFSALHKDKRTPTITDLL